MIIAIYFYHCMIHLNKEFTKTCPTEICDRYESLKKLVSIKPANSHIIMTHPTAGLGSPPI